MKYIDITLPISEDIVVWPGSKKPVIYRYSKISGEKGSNNSELKIDLHTGTHFDAPLHFLQEGKNSENSDLSRFIGECYVADFSAHAVITQAVLEDADIPDTSRLLIKTGNSGLYSQADFNENYTALEQTAANWIISKNIDLIGIDYLSVERFKNNDFSVHKTLLKKNIILLEGLDLKNASEGTYTLVSMPIRINQAEAAPVRAILLPKGILHV